jgi:cyclopropane fatty-acyl-phospholipid synthase-like methyltransferase
LLFSAHAPLVRLPILFSHQQETTALTSWYETFFSGLSVEFWIHAALPPSLEELNFLREQLAIHPGKRVLDIACGAGRHAVLLAELGYKVTSLDISAQLLSEARRFAQEREVSVDWRQGDMRTLAFDEEYDAALCFGNSFGYLSRTDTKQFLKRLSAGLRDGARFVIESGAVAESILPNLVRSRWMQVGEVLFLSSVDYDAPTSRLISRYVFIKGKRARREDSRGHCVHRGRA